MKSKTWFSATSILILGTMVYVACKTSIRPPDNFSGTLEIPGFNPYLPALKPGDTPGTVAVTATPLNNGKANIVISLTGGTPNLAVTCNWKIAGLALLSMSISGAQSSTYLDAYGNVTFEFNNVYCSLYTATNIQSQISFNCQTSQQPAIFATYTSSGLVVPFSCPFV